MRHWWNRTHAEQDAVARWVRGEAPPPLQTARAGRDAERAAYRAARAQRACGRCGGEGRILLRIHDARGQPFGRTGPCPACRPEDVERFVAQLRA